MVSVGNTLGHRRGLGKVEPAYANHEFKIIPTPTQLSAYANHELRN
jgi:hypothetical protein